MFGFSKISMLDVDAKERISRGILKGGGHYIIKTIKNTPSSYKNINFIVFTVAVMRILICSCIKKHLM